HSFTSRSLLFCYCSSTSRDLHSFPTRRSSDLVPFESQNFFQSLFFSPKPILSTKTDEEKYALLDDQEIRRLTQLEREKIVALDSEISPQNNQEAIVQLSKDFRQGIQYQSGTSVLHLQPLMESSYVPEVQYGVVHYVNRSTNNEIVSYYYNPETRVQKEWIVLANRPEIPYEYRWILANAEQYLVTPVANGGFD